MRSPWGRVLKAIREDEDAVRSLGKNVYAYKMQSLIIGGLFGSPRRLRHRPPDCRDQPDAVRHRHRPSSPTPSCWSAAQHGSSARSRARSIFWFLITFLDLFFDQATSGSNPSFPRRS